MLIKPIEKLRTEEDVGQRIKALLAIQFLLYIACMVAAFSATLSLVFLGWKPESENCLTWLQKTGGVVTAGAILAEFPAIKAKKLCADEGFGSNVIREIRQRIMWLLVIAELGVIVVAIIGIVISTFGGYFSTGLCP
ncbi:hypothetical protein [Billgrantia gudaonensis]|uniref:hypothetical protein n=1 Tax=Billgrantia gudaonensis TaxID=376427 RepID=UPI0015A1FC1A|nr:hypothetical protein [Halomonas gudaonensis]